MLKFLKDERGSVVEYIILLGVIAVIMTIAFPGVKNGIENGINNAIVSTQEDSQKSPTLKETEPIVSKPVVESTEVEVVSEPFLTQHPSIGLLLLFAFLGILGAFSYFLYQHLKKNDGKINLNIFKKD